MNKRKKLKRIAAIAMSILFLMQTLQGTGGLNGVSKGNLQGFGGVLDIVFAIDNSVNMFNYDPAADGGWIDNFVGLMEQAPFGSNFSVVTNDASISLTDAETIYYELEDILLYTAESDVYELLQNAALELENSTNEKMIVLSVASCDDYDGLIYELNELQNQGILVYLIAFEKDDKTGENIRNTYENAIVCKNAKELSVRIGDLNAYLAELRIAALPPQQSMMMFSAPRGNAMMTVAPAAQYPSSFRTGKHDYSFAVAAIINNIDNTPQQKGYYLTMLLNTYYLMPTIVYESGDVLAYELGGFAAFEAGRGNTYNLFADENAVPGEFEDFWRDKAKDLFLSQAYSYPTLGTATISALKDKIVENLKRRFPVLMTHGDGEAKLIVGWSDGDNGNDTISVFDISTGEITDGVAINIYANVKILDTQKYFNAILATPPVTDKFGAELGGNNLLQITIPNLKPDIPVKIMKHDIKSGVNDTYTVDSSVSLTLNNGADKINLAMSDMSEFTVACSVIYDNLIPNRHNTNLNYKFIPYTDINDVDWARRFIFNLTNRRVVKGYSGNTFGPRQNITIAEVLTLAVKGADVAADENIIWDEPWPNNYIDYAVSKNLFKNDFFEPENVVTYIEAIYDKLPPPDNTHSEYPDDPNSKKILAINKLRTLQVDANYKYTVCRTLPITRELAFDLLWQILISEDCRTPHQLSTYKVSGSIDDYLQFADKMTAVYTDAYKESIVQLHRNGAINGYPSGKMGPDDLINRAECCTMASKALYFYDNKAAVPIGENNTANMLTQIPLNVTVPGVLNDNGGGRGAVAFRFFAPESGLYKVTLSGANGIAFVIYETSGFGDAIKYRRVYEKASHPGYYPIKQNCTAVIAISGPAGTSFAVKIDEAVITAIAPTGKTAYVMVYDSPIKRYLDSSGTTVAGTPTTTEWDTYNRYDISQNTAFFENYLQAFPVGVTPALVLYVRDADFNTKRPDNADEAVKNAGTFSYKNANQTKPVQWATSPGFIVPSNDDAIVAEVGMTFGEYKEMVTENAAQEMADLMIGFKTAATTLNKTMPQIYLGMPHCMVLKEQDSGVFAQQYYNLAVRIYNRTLEKIIAAGMDESYITGIYNGWETTSEVYDSQGKYTAGFETLIKISKFARTRTTPKKFLWIPYGTMAGVADYVNTGVYMDEETKKSYDVFDIVVMQPGMFFDDNFKMDVVGNKVKIPQINEKPKNEIAKANQGRLNKAFDIYHSAKNNMIILGSTGTANKDAGNIGNGGKFTNTLFGVEIEYDLGLLTGRWYAGENPSYPKQKAQNLLFTLDIFKSLIYNNNVVLATHSGSANEQVYDLAGTANPNNNRHSSINYETALATKAITEENDPNYYPNRDRDIGNGKPYSWFYNYISNLAISLGEDKMKYNDALPSNLLYDITVGLFENKWTPGLKAFLAIPDGMLVQDGNNVPILQNGYYQMKTTGFYYDYLYDYLVE